MEKGEGPKLSKEWGIYAYPTLLFFDENGMVVHRTMGAMPPNKLLDNAINGLGINTSLDSMHVQYKKGNRNVDFLQKYISFLFIKNMNYSDVLTE